LWIHELLAPMMGKNGHTGLAFWDNVGSVESANGSIRKGFQELGKCLQVFRGFQEKLFLLLVFASRLLLLLPLSDLYNCLEEPGVPFHAGFGLKHEGVIGQWQGKGIYQSTKGHSVPTGFFINIFGFGPLMKFGKDRIQRVEHLQGLFHCFDATDGFIFHFKGPCNNLILLCGNEICFIQIGKDLCNRKVVHCMTTSSNRTRFD
jgi:hypothetical protein